MKCGLLGGSAARPELLRLDEDGRPRKGCQCLAVQLLSTVECDRPDPGLPRVGAGRRPTPVSGLG